MNDLAFRGQRLAAVAIGMMLSLPAAYAAPGDLAKMVQTEYDFSDMAGRRGRTKRSIAAQLDSRLGSGSPAPEARADGGLRFMSLGPILGRL